MKRFQDFLIENKIDKLNTKELTYQQFLKSVKESCMKDFKMNAQQAIEFTILYRTMLKDAYGKGLTTREAISATKRPGIIIEDGVVEESYIFDIDTVYESYIDKINSETKIENIKAYVFDYFHKFNESYSDKRIFNRVNKNYSKLINLASKRIFEMNYTKDGQSIEVDVLQRNDNLIEELIDAFSFTYKKKKDRYIRPIKITGKTLYNDVELEVVLSNKDIVKITFDNTNETEELKVHINGNLVYHLDYIDDMKIVQKASSLYDKFLERQNFKINKKVNPFN